MRLGVLRRWLAGALLVGAIAPTAGAAAQPTVTFESMVADLGHENPAVRLRAVQALKQAAYPESAVPLARSIVDTDDQVQFEAISAELNVFLAEKVIPKKRVGLVVEVRNRISAVSVFNQGASALDPRPVPAEVLAALRTAAHDDNPDVSVEALYAFGALSDNAYGPARTSLLAASAPELAAALGVPQAAVRHAAIRVIARVCAWRMGDLAVEQAVGDAVVTALNDRDSGIRLLAMDTLGLLRYDRGVQAMTDIYQHYQHGTMAVAALSGLARIAHPASLPLFTAALVGRDSLLRVHAIEGLARSGAEDQTPRILEATSRERNQDVLLAGSFANVLLANGSVNELVEGLTRSRLHERALRYLVDVAAGRARILEPHVQDPQPAVRIDLLDVLGVSGDPDALPIAERMRQDPDAAVARAATRAVSRLQAVTRRP